MISSTAVARHGGEHAADRLLFVEGRDDQRDPRPRHRSQAPAQPATGAGGRRLVAQQGAAECLVARPVPDLPQALLGRVTRA